MWRTSVGLSRREAKCQAAGVVALIAIIEAAVAAASAPWLPKHLDGFDVLLFAAVYGAVFLGAIATYNWWGRRHNSGDHASPNLKRKFE